METKPKFQQVAQNLASNLTKHQLANLKSFLSNFNAIYQASQSKAKNEYLSESPDYGATGGIADDYEDSEVDFRKFNAQNALQQEQVQFEDTQNRTIS